VTDRALASRYIHENFEASDRLAVVLLDSKKRTAIQRIGSAERIASPEFQAWLRHRNAGGREIHISMNTLRPGAKGRTKGDIESVRHIYLDFDEHGTAAVERVLNRPDLPHPNYRISSSPGRWQLVWKVERFELEQAEHLQRFLARETGADLAATDVARVLRLPGFYNYKYEKPHFITVEALSDKLRRPDEFPDPKLPLDGSSVPSRRPAAERRRSQSERDWAFAKRALARGEPESRIIEAIAAFRRDDKHDPRYYAELTVRKAAQQLQAERAPAAERSEFPER